MKFTLSYWEKECDGHWAKIQKTLIVDPNCIKLNIELPKGIYLDAVTLIKAEGQENSHPAKIMKRKRRIMVKEIIKAIRLWYYHIKYRKLFRKERELQNQIDALIRLSENYNIPIYPIK